MLVPFKKNGLVLLFLIGTFFSYAQKSIADGELSQKVKEAYTFIRDYQGEQLSKLILPAHRLYFIYNIGAVPKVISLHADSLKQGLGFYIAANEELFARKDFENITDLSSRFTQDSLYYNCESMSWQGGNTGIVIDTIHQYQPASHIIELPDNNEANFSREEIRQIKRDEIHCAKVIHKNYSCVLYFLKENNHWYLYAIDYSETNCSV